jgi:GTP-binding protein
MFVDRVTIYVKGGDGGNGALSFRREKYAPKGGPNGGDGGHGGDVVLLADTGNSNLAHLSFQRHWKADRGENGMGADCHGKTAHDMVIKVPVGTIIRDRERGHVLKDLKAHGEKVIIARGGKGGFGNAHFKSSTNRAPRQFEKGAVGEDKWIILEMKVIADVGLIGLPNAGKSTLLSRISHAHPEIADYPFTTKYPNLGTVHSGREDAFVVADIPGLIEGAHAGHGLGHEFLRHVERTRLLVHLVASEPMDESDPWKNYQTIREEIRLYSPTLAERPEIVLLTKMDLTGSDDAKARFEEQLGRPVMSISAVTGKGMNQLMHEISDRLAEIGPIVEPEPESVLASLELPKKVSNPVEADHQFESVVEIKREPRKPVEVLSPEPQETPE